MQSDAMVNEKNEDNFKVNMLLSSSNKTVHKLPMQHSISATAVVNVLLRQRLTNV